MSDLDDLAALAIECGFAIHRDLGPGLLESCYEVLPPQASLVPDWRWSGNRSSISNIAGYS